MKVKGGLSEATPRSLSPRRAERPKSSLIRINSPGQQALPWTLSFFTMAGPVVQTIQRDPALL